MAKPTTGKSGYGRQCQKEYMTHDAGVGISKKQKNDKGGHKAKSSANEGRFKSVSHLFR